MALDINVPNSAYSEQLVTLSGKQYLLRFTFNSRDNRWRIDIELDGVAIFNGLKVLENADLTGWYTKEDFNSGILACVRNNKTDEPVGRDNLGIDKDYSIYYFTAEELIG